MTAQSCMFLMSLLFMGPSNHCPSPAQGNQAASFRARSGDMKTTIAPCCTDSSTFCQHASPPWGEHTTAERPCCRRRCAWPKICRVWDCINSPTLGSLNSIQLDSLHLTFQIFSSISISLHMAMKWFLDLLRALPAHFVWYLLNGTLCLIGITRTTISVLNGKYIGWCLWAGVYWLLHTTQHRVLYVHSGCQPNNSMHPEWSRQEDIKWGIKRWGFKRKESLCLIIGYSTGY